MSDHVTGSSSDEKKNESSVDFLSVSNDVCVIKDCYKYKGVVLEDFVDKQSIQKIPYMEVYEDDTFIVSYPRTGWYGNL